MTSLRNYAAGETVMPLTALDALDGVIPNELLSLLFNERTALVQVPEGIDHDRLAADFADYLKAKNDCHHPESEAGRDIGPNEDALLCSKVVRITGRAA